MIRRALRLVYRNLLPSRARGYLDLFEEIRRKEAAAPRIVAAGDLEERRVLALAPHPDDEVFGCGGTLGLYHQAGASVFVAYMTDGRKGSSAYREEELVGIREKEAAESSKVLGIDRIFFLGARDGELSRSPAAASKLSGILAETRPEAIFLPFLLDGHPDHVATNDVFAAASRGCPLSFTCYGYEVWTPLPLPNLLVDISGSIDLKREAIEKYKSQTENAALADAAFGLSRYRAVMHGVGRGYAEAFFRCHASEYLRFWRAATHAPTQA